LETHSLLEVIQPVVMAQVLEMETRTMVETVTDEEKTAVEMKDEVADNEEVEMVEEELLEVKIAYLKYIVPLFHISDHSRAFP
jgi:hypothetical protein